MLKIIKNILKQIRTGEKSFFSKESETIGCPKNERREPERSAFTLIELIVVMAIIAILVLLASAKYTGYTQKAELIRIKNDSKVVGTLVDEQLIAGEQISGTEISQEELNAFALEGKLYSFRGKETEAASGVYYLLTPEFTSSSKLKGSFYADSAGNTYYVGRALDAAIEDVQEDPSTDSQWFIFDPGTGTITGYYDSLTVNEEIVQSPKDIIIPSEIDGVSVVAIGNRAFYQKEITAVVFPDSIISIEDDAFMMNRLTSVAVPEGIVSISSGALKFNHLKQVALPQGLKAIESGAFSNNSLETIPLPQGLERIEDWAFSSNSLLSIEIPDSVYHVGHNAFRGNNIQNLNLPNSVEFVGTSAFVGNGIKTLILSENLTSISTDSFSGNDIVSLTIPDSVATIEMYAFKGSNISLLDLGAGVTTIRNGAFKDNNLTSLTLSENLTGIGANVFENNFISEIIWNDKIDYASGSAFASNLLSGEIVLPDSLSSLGPYAFVDNNLSKITFGSAFKSGDRDTFKNNPITSVTFTSLPENNMSIDSSFVNTNTTLTYIGPGTYTLNGTIWAIQ